jgi:hypothetical protein
MARTSKNSAAESARRSEAPVVKTLLVLAASSAFGAVGWWLGSLVGFGTALFVSLVASGYGIWISRRFLRDHLG